MNSGMKDMLNVMDKFLAMGMSVDDVIRRSTWNPAREIQHEELGNLSVGATADVAVLSRETGKFGFTDMYGARLQGTQKLIVRTHAPQRQGGLRPQRHHAHGLGEAAEELPADRRSAMGWLYAAEKDPTGYAPGRQTVAEPPRRKKGRPRESAAGPSVD